MSTEKTNASFEGLTTTSNYDMTKTDNDQQYYKDDSEDFFPNPLTHCLYKQLHMHLNIYATNNDCIDILKCELRENSNLYENIQELQDAINEDNDTNIINILALAASPFKTKIILSNGSNTITFERKDKE